MWVATSRSDFVPAQIPAKDWHSACPIGGATGAGRSVRLSRLRKVMVACGKEDQQAPPAGRLGSAKATNGPGSHDLYRECS